MIQRNREPLAAMLGVLRPPCCRKSNMESSANISRTLQLAATACPCCLAWFAKAVQGVFTHPSMESNACVNNQSMHRS